MARKSRVPSPDETRRLADAWMVGEVARQQRKLERQAKCLVSERNEIGMDKAERMRRMRARKKAGIARLIYIPVEVGMVQRLEKSNWLKKAAAQHTYEDVQAAIIDLLRNC